MKNERIKKIKILLVICILFLLILIIIVNLMKKKEENEIRNVGSIEVTMTEKSINMQNFDDVLSELPMKSITMHVKVQDYVLEYVKKVYYSLHEASEKEIEEYYKENLKEIQTFLYDDNIGVFKKFVQQLNQMNAEKLICTEIIFDKQTFEQMNNQYSFQMKIKYNTQNYLTYIVHIDKGEDNTIDNYEILFEPIL